MNYDIRCLSEGDKIDFVGYLKGDTNREVCSMYESPTDFSWWIHQLNWCVGYQKQGMSF